MRSDARWHARPDITGSGQKTAIRSHPLQQGKQKYQFDTY